MNFLFQLHVNTNNVHLCRIELYNSWDWGRGGGSRNGPLEGTATMELYSCFFSISTILLFEKLMDTTYFVVVVLQQPKATDLCCRLLAASPGARLGGVGVTSTPLHTPTLKELISSQHACISTRGWENQLSPYSYH